jgi:hypothetical protein
MEKVVQLIRNLLSNFLPCDQEAAGEIPDGGVPAVVDPTGGESASGGEPAQSDADALAKAADLEAANVRIEELTGQVEAKDAEVEKRAQELLFEVMPEVGEINQGAAMPQQFHPGQPGVQQQTPGVEEPEELTDEELLKRQVAYQGNQIQQIQDNSYAQQLHNRLEGLQGKYPEMDRYRVVNYLMGLGNQAEKVNLDRLCEISHKKESARLQTHAEAYHLAELKKIQEGGNPPPTPGRPEGTPNEGVKVTRQNAATVFAQRLAARGFGR